MIFVIENSLWKSNLALFNKTAKLGEASGDAHNQGGWLVLQYLLNKWVTEGAYKGVASNPHDSTLDV